jgi:hypothetical protein
MDLNRTALQELAAVIEDPDFEHDPGGMLVAWANIVSGNVDPDERYRPAELLDIIAQEPQPTPHDDLCAKIARLTPENRAILEKWLDIIAR